jgi:hypothetical protein
MTTKIEQDYEEGLKFLITDTGEDTIFWYIILPITIFMLGVIISYIL